MQIVIDKNNEIKLPIDVEVIFKPYYLASKMSKTPSRDHIYNEMSHRINYSKERKYPRNILIALIENILRKQ